ncbi:hypothetical protein [Lysobacter silvisoli]|uniref:Uncharacterized protein n=1 Tax=Lysobacter silvisoli TaxID=2293254 RepID=A0A371K2L0_9GAMM|nr:hypothetical protein [Lysobacter silvisoli]RDZ28114.1 hypothetical protein DX914_02925 [Lysobacter silvisoli]
MIKFLQGLFGGKSTVEATASVSQATQTPPAARWLSKDDPKNPFVVDGYDCLAFARSMLSTTADPQVADSFLQQRGSLGQEHAGQLPADAISVDCRLPYPFTGETAEGALFKASCMEEKWDIYLYGDRLYFCRSWTGSLVFVAQFTATDGVLTISRIAAPASDAGSDDAYIVRQVHYLVCSHLFKKALPHPLPIGLDPKPDSVALFSFGQYGRVCCFGTFEETVRQGIKKPSNPNT